jgi:hypothetical protein
LSSHWVERSVTQPYRTHVKIDLEPSQNKRVAIDSLAAFTTVLAPSCDETIIDETPTPSIQAHRGVGGRCARGKKGSALAVAIADACSPYLPGIMQGTVRLATICGPIPRGQL